MIAIATWLQWGREEGKWHTRWQCWLFKEQLTPYQRASVVYLSQDCGIWLTLWNDKSKHRFWVQGCNNSAQTGKSGHARGSWFVNGLHCSQPSLSAGLQTQGKVISASDGILRFTTITNEICLVKIKLANFISEPHPPQSLASEYPPLYWGSFWKGWLLKGFS